MAENQASNAAADVEMSQYVADRTRVNEDKIKQDDEIIEQFGDYNYGWHDTDFAGEAAKKGIDENVVRAISADKHEPEWMLEKRLEGYRDFIDRPMPQWGVDLKDFDADDFKYYVKPIDKQATTWEELPDEIKSTLSETEVTADMLASGDRLMDLPLPDDELVVTVKRDGAFFIPNGRSKLCLGDKLLVISHSERGQILQTK